MKVFPCVSRMFPQKVRPGNDALSILHALPQHVNTSTRQHLNTLEFSLRQWRDHTHVIPRKRVLVRNSLNILFEVGCAVTGFSVYANQDRIVASMMFLECRSKFE